MFVSIVQSVSVRNIVSLQKSLPSSESSIPIVCAKNVCANMPLNKVFSFGWMLFVTRKIKKAVGSYKETISLLLCCCHPTLIGIFFGVVSSQGLEPWTHWLRVSCSTNWATKTISIKNGVQRYYFFLNNERLYSILSKYKLR